MRRGVLDRNRDLVKERLALRAREILARGEAESIHAGVELVTRWKQIGHAPVGVGGSASHGIRPAVVVELFEDDEDALRRFAQRRVEHVGAD